MLLGLSAKSHFPGPSFPSFRRFAQGAPGAPWLQLEHPALRVAHCAWALQPGPAAAGEAVTAEGGAAEGARRRPGRWNPGFPSV